MTSHVRYTLCISTYNICWWCLAYSGCRHVECHSLIMSNVTSVISNQLLVKWFQTLTSWWNSTHKLSSLLNLEMMCSERKSLSWLTWLLETSTEHHNMIFKSWRNLASETESKLQNFRNMLVILKLIFLVGERSPWCWGYRARLQQFNNQVRTPGALLRSI